MGSRKAGALDRLKAALMERFGPENEATVTREIQRHLSGKGKITVADLNTVETGLALKLPATGNSKRKTSMSQVKRRPISLFPTTPEGYSAGKTDLNVSVPLVSDLVPITTGKRILAPISPSPFPCFDGTSVQISHISPDCQRDRSPFDHGLPENQRFQGLSRRQIRRIPDSWGKVIQWDSAKYLKEQENRKAQRLEVRSSYRKDLDRQVERKKQAELSANQEENKFKAELSASLADLEAEKTQKTALHAAKKEQQRKVLALLQAIAKEQEKRKKTALLLERSQLDQLIKEEKEYAVLLNHRKKTLMCSIQHEQMQMAASKMIQRREKRAKSQAQARYTLNQDKAALKEETKKAKETTFLRNKELSVANLTSATLHKSKSGTETTAKVDEMPFFLDADRRAAARQQLQKEVIAVLAMQRKEHEERRQLRGRESSLQTESGEKDKEKIEKQQKLGKFLREQVQERQKRLEEEKQFSLAEMQINRSLIDAASAAFLV